MCDHAINNFKSNHSIQMKMLGYEINHRRFRRMFLVSLATAMFITSINSVVSAYGFFMSDIFEIKLFHLIFITLYAFQSLAPAAFLSIYSYFLLNTRLRFRLLNVAVRNTLGPSNTIIRIFYPAAEEVIHSLNVFAQLHDNLTLGTGLINECYSFQVRGFVVVVETLRFMDFIIVFVWNFQILAYLTSLFSNCLGCLFRIYDELTTDVNAVNHAYDAVTYPSWALYNLAYIWLLIYVTEITVNEVSIQWPYNIEWRFVSYSY